MKIASSQVAMSNDYRQKYAFARKETLVQPGNNGETTVDISDATRRQLRVQAEERQSEAVTGLIDNSEKVKKSDGFAESTYYDKGLYIMKMLLERMSGRSIDLFDTHRFMDHVNSGENQLMQGDISQMSMTAQGQGGNNGQNNGGDLIQISEYRYEKQSNFLEFSGAIETEDGKTTQFNFAVGFSQEYESISTQTVRREELKDPLVISFSTNPVQLSNKRFEFDIDNDEQKDNIAMLEAGYGFLALDKNGDDVINNGSELFGALSGNGFAELAEYDDNQDGFIDENDKIFKDLSVWIKNENEDKLVSLKESGIGAISLQNVDSPLTIRSEDEKLAMVRKSGFYLNENGSAGLIQQLDFVV